MAETERLGCSPQTSCPFIQLGLEGFILCFDRLFLGACHHERSIIPRPHSDNQSDELFIYDALVTTNGGGALYPPVAWDAHDKERGNPCTRSSALLAQAFQHLWLVVCDDVYRAFTWVRPTIHPRPVSVVVLTDTSYHHGCDARRVTVGSLSEGSVRVVPFPH